MQSLPVLRADLEFHPAPSDVDGTPGVLIRDPLRGVFHRADWVQAQVLRHLRQPTTMQALMEALCGSLTVAVDEAYVLECCQDAAARGLTDRTRVRSVAALRAELVSHDTHPLVAVLQAALYQRVPLLQPDSFLARTQSYVRWLVSPWMIACWLVLTAFGLSGVALQGEAYLASFPRVLVAESLLAYALAIAVTKAIHEFAHAYTARALGCRVPVMGLALIFCMPVPFCDVTDTWRLRDRRARWLVSAAGMLAELALAGLALCVWRLAPPGPWREGAHVVSTVTLASTLLINLNPAMRYDGYYMLSDLLGVDNLRARSAAVARAWLRRTLLGMAVADAEPGASPGMRAALVGYALGAWLYRFGLSLTIAAMLYTMVWKGVGVVLMGYAVTLFLLMPAVNEVRSLHAQRSRLRWNPRLMATVLGLLLLLGWMALPWPRRESAPGVLLAPREQRVYTPFAGEVETWTALLGQEVAAGEMLLAVRSRELETEHRTTRLREAALQRTIRAVALDAEEKTRLPRYREDAARLRSAGEALQEILGRSPVRAVEGGRVVSVDPSVREGGFVPAGQEVARIVGEGPPRLVCLLREAELPRLQVGTPVRFSCSGIKESLAGAVTRIADAPSRVPPHPALAAAHGGAARMVRGVDGKWIALEALYEVEITLDGAPEAGRWPGRTGTVHYRSPPRSLLWGWLRAAWLAYLRESGA